MTSQIALPENLTIHSIDALYNELTQQFTDTDDVITLEASAVESIDTSGLQVLLILVKNATENEKQIVWQNVPEILKTSAQKLGLTEGLQLS